MAFENLQHAAYYGLDEATLAELIAPWGLSLSNLLFVQDSFNVVYRVPAEFLKAERPAYLRISQIERNSVAEVQAELDWVHYLAENGVDVCRPVSPEQTYDVTVAGAFAAILVEEVGGRPLEDADWGPALFTRLGKLMGQMHRLSRDYRPVSPKRIRPHHHEAEARAAIASNLTSPADEPVLETLAELRELQRHYPMNSDAYGLIHTDIHSGNYHLDEEKIYLFDFDDSCYHWLAADVGNTIYYALWHNSRHAPDSGSARAQFAARFLDAFLDGYERECRWDPVWRSWLTAFVEQRDILVYAYLRGRYGEMPDNESVARFLNQRRRRFAAGERYVMID